jgi:GT2 family glycosyltransferase
VDKLVRFLKVNKKVGIAGATVYDVSGKFYQAGVYKIINLGKNLYYSERDVEIAKKINGVLICESVHGDIYAVRREVIEEIGGFDPYNFPMLYTDGDLCLRVLSRGYKIVILPEAKAYHDHTRLSSLEYYSLSAERIRDTVKAKLIFIRLYTKSSIQRIAIPVYLLIHFMYYLRIFLRKDSRNILPLSVAYIKGIFDGFTHKIYQKKDMLYQEDTYA